MLRLEAENPTDHSGLSNPMGYYAYGLKAARLAKKVDGKKLKQTMLAEACGFTASYVCSIERCQARAPLSG